MPPCQRQIYYRAKGFACYNAIVYGGREALRDSGREKIDRKGLDASLRKAQWVGCAFLLVLTVNDDHPFGKRFPSVTLIQGLLGKVSCDSVISVVINIKFSENSFTPVAYAKAHDANPEW